MQVTSIVPVFSVTPPKAQAVFGFALEDWPETERGPEDEVAALLDPAKVDIVDAPQFSKTLALRPEIPASSPEGTEQIESDLPTGTKPTQVLTQSVDLPKAPPSPQIDFAEKAPNPISQPKENTLAVAPAAMVQEAKQFIQPVEATKKAGKAPAEIVKSAQEPTQSRLDSRLEGRQSPETTPQKPTNSETPKSGASESLVNLRTPSAVQTEGVIAEAILSDSGAMPPDTQRSALNAPVMQAIKTYPATQVTTQIAQAVVEMKHGNADIMLAPEELGRVKIRLEPSGDGITIHVTTERSDTQDLIRRNLAVLSDDMRNAGFKDVTFDFGDQSQGAHSDGDTHQHTDFDQEPVEVLAILPVHSESGLDIRL